MGGHLIFTYDVNPGEVWEEDEFWIELSWRIDPDGSLGIRKHFISPYRPERRKLLLTSITNIFLNIRKHLPEEAKSRLYFSTGLYAKIRRFSRRKVRLH
ncbi:MAG: hypothetical protein R2788_16350 [Saprospiraceae bacterium]